MRTVWERKVVPTFTYLTRNQQDLYPLTRYRRKLIELIPNPLREMDFTSLRDLLRKQLLWIIRESTSIFWSHLRKTKRSRIQWRLPRPSILDHKTPISQQMQSKRGSVTRFTASQTSIRPAVSQESSTMTSTSLSTNKITNYSSVETVSSHNTPIACSFANSEIIQIWAKTAHNITVLNWQFR